MKIIKKHYPILALAGRRTDADSTLSEIRFPVENIPLVKQRLRKLFQELNPDLLISSAAAGADLLALEAAYEMGIHRRIVVPVETEDFRKDSVVDRGEAWGERFDRVLKSPSDIISMNCIGGDHETFLAANERILDEAMRFALKVYQGSKRDDPNRSAAENVLAVIVWDGSRSGVDDVTASFMDSAISRGIDVASINTQSVEY